MEEKLPENLLRIIENGEGITIEFKEDEIFKVRIPLVKQEENKYIDSQELKSLLFKFISNSEGKNRKEINDYIYPILKENISIMNNRVRTALTFLRKKGYIENSGTDTKPIWIKSDKLI